MGRVFHVERSAGARSGSAPATLGRDAGTGTRPILERGDPPQLGSEVSADRGSTWNGTRRSNASAALVRCHPMEAPKPWDEATDSPTWHMASEQPRSPRETRSTPERRIDRTSPPLVTPIAGRIQCRTYTGSLETGGPRPEEGGREAEMLSYHPVQPLGCASTLVDSQGLGCLAGRMKLHDRHLVHAAGVGSLVPPDGLVSNLEVAPSSHGMAGPWPRTTTPVLRPRAQQGCRARKLYTF